MKIPNIMVIGSFVMDLIVSTQRMPKSGETVLGSSFHTAPGGKGANQAVQAALLGAQVTMVGKVGNDEFGKQLLASCKKVGIDVSHVIVENDVPSAVGNILLEHPTNGSSSNRIIVVPGANMRLSVDDVSFLKNCIDEYDIVIMQLEIPLEVNETVAALAMQHGVPVMLNSAPSAKLSEEFLKNITYLCPNEHEAADISGTNIRSNDLCIKDDTKKVINRLIAMGAKNVIVTLGDQGAAFGNGTDYYLCPSVPYADLVDPTAAGDSFVGAFCIGVCLGLNYKQAINLANCAASITISRVGAQPSIPTLKETIQCLHRHCKDRDLITFMDQYKVEREKEII